jgi:hypothetical protein
VGLSALPDKAKAFVTWLEPSTVPTRRYGRYPCATTKRTYKYVHTHTQHTHLIHVPKEKNRVLSIQKESVD